MTEIVEQKLTDKQKLFAEFYVGECSLNATRAAERAGYSGSYSVLSVVGFENLRKPNVRAYIDELLKGLTLSQNEVLTILTKQAKASLADVLNDNGEFDLSDAKKRGVDGLLKKLKVKETYSPITKETETTYEYELYDAQAAAVHIGRYHKLFTDKSELTGKDDGPIEHKHTHDLSRLSTDELLKLKEINSKLNS